MEKVAVLGLGFVALPAITAVSARMGEMCAEGCGELDFSALAKAYA